MDNLSEIILSPDYFCPLMNMCEPDNFFMPIDVQNDIEKILVDKPAYLEDDDFIDKIYENVLAKDKQKDGEPRRTISAIQFTDIHLDLEYKVGSNILCNNWLCCRHADGYPDDPELQAGPYGSLA